MPDSFPAWMEQVLRSLGLVMCKLVVLFVLFDVVCVFWCNLLSLDVVLRWLGIFVSEKQK